MENYTKLFSLIKVAGWFGDTRRILTYMRKKKIPLTRKNPELLIFNQTAYDPVKKSINVARVDYDTTPPITKLFHEFGHAINDKKNNLKKDIRTYVKDKKLERIANSNALQWITEPKDREAYKKLVRKPYYTHSDDSVKVYFHKKRTGKMPESYSVADEKNLHITDNNFNSSIKPALRKKPWER